MTDVVRTISLPPDPGLVRSLGTNHSLQSSIADLIDNSMDAGAGVVLVRFVWDGLRLQEVQIHDDGRGMDAHAIDDAMTLGRRRDYNGSDLGHFGVGLKAASLAHADHVVVWSSTQTGACVGRRIHRHGLESDFECEVLTDESARQARELRRLICGSGQGTTVTWSGMRTGYQGASPSEAERWIAEEVQRTRSHLGVVFHRILGRGDVTVMTEVAAPGGDGHATQSAVEPIDPFGYASSGRPGYPKELTASAGAARVRLTCHIWPGDVDVPAFRLMGEPGERWQGIFVYRNDRLLQLGGWSDIASSRKDRQLARIVLDAGEAVGPFITMNAEKQGLRFTPAFRQAVADAVATDGTTFEQFLTDAQDALRESRRRNKARRPAATPGKGFAPVLRRTIGHELPLSDAEIQVKWKALPPGEFIEIDFSAQTVWLNKAHRAHFVGPRGGMNDAPVIKALVYLLTQHLFTGSHLGWRDKDDIALYRAVLAAALRAELSD